MRREKARVKSGSIGEQRDDRRVEDDVVGRGRLLKTEDQRGRWRGVDRSRYAGRDGGAAALSKKLARLNSRARVRDLPDKAASAKARERIGEENRPGIT